MIKVGVVRGGPSSEYQVSLLTGGNILSHLSGEKLNSIYKGIDILIDKRGAWHLNGIPTTLEKIFYSTDVIFNALHGDFGEDGKIQQILNQWRISYTGSGSFSSALGFNKVLAKERFHFLGLKTPKHLLFPAYQEDIDAIPDLYGEGAIQKYAERKAYQVLGKISPPWIVKPLTGGSSVGMYLCKTFPELVSAFKKIIDIQSSILVEEFIKGKEATVGVIQDFRGQEIYALPPIEIKIPANKDFFDYEAKYSGKTEEICPGNFTYQEKEELQKIAQVIHQGLHLDHYSRSDFIVHPQKGIYVLEVNTLPGLTDESLMPKGLKAIGVEMPEFIDHLIKLARNNKSF